MHRLLVIFAWNRPHTPIEDAVYKLMADAVSPFHVTIISSIAVAESCSVLDHW